MEEAVSAPVEQAARLSRNFISFLALAACVATLVLIVNGPYGELWFGGARVEQEADVADTHADQASGPAGVSPQEDRRYRALSGFVANRYRVSQDVAYELVGLSHRVGHEVQLDPLLIIAVIAVESSFNPIAESVAGAKGLMQIIPKYHGAKLEAFGGEKAIYDPEANIHVGARILKEYLRNTGNIGSALQMYAGALNDADDHYTGKVLGVKQRLQAIASQPPVLPGAPIAVKTTTVRPSKNAALPLE